MMMFLSGFGIDLLTFCLFDSFGCRWWDVGCLRSNFESEQRITEDWMENLGAGGIFMFIKQREERDCATIVPPYVRLA